MWSMVRRLFRRNNTADMLGRFLAQAPNREELLGMKIPVIPTPEGIRTDAARIVRHSDTADYKAWVDEAWGRIIHGLDKILDERSSNEVRQYHCGAVRSTLDLLRVSYTARYVMEQYDSEHTASLRQKPQKQG